MNTSYTLQLATITHRYSDAFALFPNEVGNITTADLLSCCGVERDVLAVENAGGDDKLHNTVSVSHASKAPASIGLY